MTYD
jgi:hypothetical protein